MTTRYTPTLSPYEYGLFADMTVHPQGDYVTWSDYEDLVERYKKLCGIVREDYLETP